MDALGLYPNIPHEQVCINKMSALTKWLENRNKKYISNDTVTDLAKVVLKNNTLTFVKNTLELKQGTAIGTKFALPYSILFMTDLAEEIIKESEYKPYLWWRYDDDIFLLCEDGENK